MASAHYEGKPGPAPTTGIFDTREDLESYIHDQYINKGFFMREIAPKAGVSVALVCEILKEQKEARQAGRTTLYLVKPRSKN